MAVSAIPYQKGYKIKIIDERVDRNWKNNLISHLKKAPICVGTTCMTGSQIPHALKISSIVKNNSDVPMVWGGIHPSLTPKQTIENQLVDIIITGEGDYTFFELVEHLEKEKSLSNVKGLYYKINDKIKKYQNIHTN